MKSGSERTTIKLHGSYSNKPVKYASPVRNGTRVNNEVRGFDGLCTKQEKIVEIRNFGNIKFVIITRNKPPLNNKQSLPVFLMSLS